MARQILLNAFDMACVGHIQQGMWTHPRDTSADYASLDHWMDLARLLEGGLFDGLFLADVLGIYDVLDGRPDAALRHAVQVPLIDPMLIVPAMAAVTRHLGFGVTCNLGYEAPYMLARRFSTLDHLTRGRIGWNIVTGYLDSAARAMGMAAQMAHDDRYDMADEFLDVVYGLWQRSWDDDAVVKRDGVFTDPAKVRAIHHAGKQYRLDAPHLCEPSPQRTPVLYQAGASERGRVFAARHAECVFLNGGASAAVAAQVADLRARTSRNLRIFLGATVIVGRTEAEARDKFEDYRRHASVEGALAHAAASMGIDFAKYGPDQPIEGSGNAIQSNVTSQRQAAGGALTRRKLEAQFLLGSRQAPIIGSAEQVADALVAWVDEADVDGFNLSRSVVPECLADFIELVLPELQERGRYKTSYAEGTLRDKLFGAGPRLRAPHPAS